uniref:Uncharacterized protein n=1 Tax=Anguilla anguilla TaxID=7936 RepID=A0A0E9TI81_ANGAN
MDVNICKLKLTACSLSSYFCIVSFQIQ